MKHTPGFLAIVNDAKSRVKELGFREVKQKLDAGEKFTLVDVREDNEWARGHLPGAVHLSKGIIERDIETAIPDKSATLVLYCGGGFPLRAGRGQPAKNGLHERYFHGWRLALLDRSRFSHRAREIKSLPRACAFRMQPLSS